MLKTFAGGRLFGVVHSAGANDQPWVLALPGWTRTYRDFDQVLEGLDALAVDLPGFGSQAPPPAAWTTAEYAEWVAPILDELSPNPVVLGHSFGGRVGLHLAAAHPDRVGALVLTGVPRLVSDPSATSRGRRPKPAMAFRAARALHRAKLLSDARMESMRQRYGSADYRAASGVMRAVLVKAVNETYQRQLAAYPGPIELVWGEDDDVAPIAIAEHAVEVGQNATLIAVPGVGHFVPQQAPAALRQAVVRHRPHVQRP
jgi:pimeloyl-ACP methyl ester carboxylesterase